MIDEFEQRLSEVIGARLPPPFQGRVAVEPGGAADNAAPRVLVGVREAEPVQNDIGSRRPEALVPADALGRIVRLECTVGLRVIPGDGEGRRQQVLGLDAALYTLDGAELRDGSALHDDTDRGFFIEKMRIMESRYPFGDEGGEADAAELLLEAKGWFWPKGAPAEEAGRIGEIRIRGAVIPIDLDPVQPELTAGGAATEFTLHVGAAGTMQLKGDPVEPFILPFGSLALSLSGPGGKPGLGTLSGGVNGEDGFHLVSLENGTATFRYTPPDEAADDMLLIALDDGEGRSSIEFGRFPLKVREG